MLFLTACQSPGTRPAADPRFIFGVDTFAYANNLLWTYGFDENGKWTSEAVRPKPDYTHHCFVMVRSARQFFQHARFAPDEPKADDLTYRRLIREVVDRSPRKTPPPNERIIIPGYSNLWEFSRSQERLLQRECGSFWQSYFQRGHWRMVFPFSRGSQSQAAEYLLENTASDRPPIIHLVRFPSLKINHAVLVCEARPRQSTIDFLVYDPNTPAAPVILKFDRELREFQYPQTDYFPGGRVDVYEVYYNALY